jgi:hypothetical protein
MYAIDFYSNSDGFLNHIDILGSKWTINKSILCKF